MSARSAIYACCRKASLNKVMVAFLCIIFIPLQLPAQENIRLKKCQKIHRYPGTCSLTYIWFEPFEGNKQINQKVSAQIRKAMSVYFVDKDDAIEICSGKMEYDAEMEVLCRRYDFLSCFFTSYEYFKGTPHGFRRFSTLTFNMQTGQGVELCQFLDSTRMQALHFDSLLYNKLAQRMGTADLFVLKPYLENWMYASYVLYDEKLIIYLRGESYADSMLEIEFTKEELEIFITPPCLAYRWKNAGL